MRTSLWVVIALVSGLVGFLMGYSVSAYTGNRSLEKLQEMAEKDARPVEEKAGGQPSGGVQKAQVEEEKAGGQPSGGVQKAQVEEEKVGGQPSGGVQKAQVEEERVGRPAETAAGSEAGGGAAAMPASPKAASPKPVSGGRSGGRSTRKAQAKEGTKATGSSAGY
jgi:hypothetical protein